MKYKITYGKIILATFLGAACGIMGGPIGIALGGLLALGITVAAMINECWTVNRKFDSILTRAVIGGLCAIPCSLSGWYLSVYESFNLVILPLHITIAAPIFYSFLFSLGLEISRRKNYSGLAAFNVIYVLMFCGGVLRLYPLLLYSYTLIYAFWGAVATVTIFTLIVFLTIFNKVFFKEFFQARAKTSCLTLEIIILTIVALLASFSYGTRCRDWLFEAGMRNPEIMKKVDMPFYADGKIYWNCKEYNVDIKYVEGDYILQKESRSYQVLSVSTGATLAQFSSSLDNPAFKLSRDKSNAALLALLLYEKDIGTYELYSIPDWKVQSKITESGARFCWSGTGKLIIEEAGKDNPALRMDRKVFAYGRCPTLAKQDGMVVYRRKNNIYGKTVGGREKQIGSFNKKITPHDYNYCGMMRISPDGRFLLYSSGMNSMFLHHLDYYLIKDLKTGEEHIWGQGFGWSSRYVNWLSPEVAKLIIEKYPKKEDQ